MADGKNLAAQVSSVPTMAVIRANTENIKTLITDRPKSGPKWRMAVGYYAKAKMAKPVPKRAQQCRPQPVII